MLDGDKVIQFRCHKDVKCWNACCSNIDITLTPYDVLRLKTTSAFPPVIPQAIHRPL